MPSAAPAAILPGMIVPPPPLGDGPGGLSALNARSREIFRRVVDSYLATGEPLGSRNLSRILPMALTWGA